MPFFLGKGKRKGDLSHQGKVFFENGFFGVFDFFPDRSALHGDNGARLLDKGTGTLEEAGQGKDRPGNNDVKGVPVDAREIQSSIRACSATIPSRLK